MSRSLCENPDRVYIQLYSTAPAPSRDYHGLKVTEQQVVLNTWNVTHGRYVFPKVRKIDLDEFLGDPAWQQDVAIIFGKHMSDFIANIARKTPVLCGIPNRAMLKVLSYLSCNDILKLSQTSKIFWQLCNSNSAWRILFMKRNKTPVRLGASPAGLDWKKVLRKSLDTSTILRRASVRPLRASLSLHSNPPVDSSSKTHQKSKSLTSLQQNYCRLNTDD